MEFQAAAQRNHTPEPCNEVFEFRVPKPEHLDEAESATQINPDLEHPNEKFKCGVPEPEQLDEAKADTQIKLDWSIKMRKLNPESMNQRNWMGDLNLE